MAIGNDLVSGALRVISSLGVGEPIPGEESDYALSVLNMMLAAWSAEALMIPARTLEPFPLVIGQASYTIGAGANFNTSRPDYLTDAFIRDTAGQDSLLDTTMTKEEYNAIPLKTVSAKPARLYYDTQYPNGVIYLDAAPGIQYTLYLESLKPVTQFPTIQSTLNMPGEYQEAIKYLLAERLAPEYGFAITPDIRKLITDAEKRILRKNTKMKVAGFDAALIRPRRFDVNAGRWW